MQQCISTVSYRISVNGIITILFVPQCELRPFVSLFISILYGHLLANDLFIHLLKGIRIRRQGPEVSHLFFADDSLLKRPGGMH